MATLWHQGMLSRERHPSLAHVAFTSVTETVAKSDWARLRGVAAQAGPSQRFAQAVRLVASDGELEILERLAYA